LYSEFLQLLPTGANSSFTSTGNVVDFDRLLPKIKDFYRARGTEKSYRFLIRLLTGGDSGDDTSLYYPKTNVFKASDGKWFIQRSIRVSNTTLNAIADSSLETFSLFTNKKIKGLTSNSTAIVDRVEQFFELGTQVNEIFLSSISNTFIGGETVQSNTVNSTGHIVDLRANIFSGFVSSVSVVEGGKGYLVGDPVVLTGGGGSGAIAVVSEVTRGNIETIQVASGGSGYTTADFLVFTGGGGSGANANISVVLDDSSRHPNSYNIVAHSNSLFFIANSTWNASGNIWTVTTSNLAQNSINSLGSVFRYTNTGPASIVTVTGEGVNYTSLPTISVASNSQITSLGILGSLRINSGGTGYSVGDRLVFTNPFNGWGHGANGNVASVNTTTGEITKVQYIPEGDANGVLGGTGYENGFLPSVSVISSGGVGADITVESTLGTGALFSPNTGTIGTVTSISVVSGGSGYLTAPTADLSGRGDGNATALVAVIQGIFTYPGYFLNQDGFPSSFNFLQDRDYYQNYSYVLRAAKTSFTSWIQSVLNLVHPSGLKVFGEYLVIEDSSGKNQYLNSNAITGSFGYDSIRSQDLSPESNAIYFPGNSYVWSSDSISNGVTGIANTHAALGSFWFKLDSDAPALINVGGPEMTIFEIAGPPPSYNAAHKVFIGRAKDPAGVNFIPWSSNLEVTGANTWTRTNISVDKNVLRISIPDANGSAYSLPLDRIRSNTGVTGQYFLRHAFGGVAPFPSAANTLYDTGNKQVIYSFYAKSGTSANNDKIAVRISNAVTPQVGTIFYCNTVNGHVYQTTSNIVSGYAYSNVANIGNGVYRYVFFTNPALTTASTTFDVFKLSNTHPTDITQTYAYSSSESANDGIIIGGFQIEPGNTSASIHVPTFAPSELPKYVYPNTAPEELFVGFRFKNVNTGVTQAEFRTDYRKNPIVANNWYHVLVSANLCSNGVYHEIPHNQGIFLNNVYSQIIVSTGGAWPSGQSANLIGIAHSSFGGNTFLNYPTINTALRTLTTDASRGGLKFKGYIGDFFWQPNYTINANPQIVSIAPQVYVHVDAFLVSNTLSSNVLGLGPLYGGSGANLANIGINVTTNTMIQIEPRYFFKGTTGPGRAGQFDPVPPSANLANLNSGFSGFAGSYHSTGQALQFVDGETVQEPVAVNPYVPKGLQPGPGEDY
jgi:hypothetical protein